MVLWTFYRVPKHISRSNLKFQTLLPTADPTNLLEAQYKREEEERERDREVKGESEEKEREKKKETGHCRKQKKVLEVAIWILCGTIVLCGGAVVLIWKIIKFKK